MTIKLAHGSFTSTIHQTTLPMPSQAPPFSQQKVIRLKSDLETIRFVNPTFN